MTCKFQVNPISIGLSFCGILVIFSGKSLASLETREECFIIIFLFKVVRDPCPTSSAKNRCLADLHEIVHTSSLTPPPSASVFIFSKENSVS